MRGWTDAVVALPPQVAVAPVEHPDAVCLDMPEPGDREPRPIPADLGRPGRSTLQNRDRPTTHVELDPDVVTQVDRDPSFAVAPNSREVEIGKGGLRRGHGAQQATEPTAWAQERLIRSAAGAGHDASIVSGFGAYEAESAHPSSLAPALLAAQPLERAP